MADASCFSDGQMAGAVIGSVVGTLVICVLVAIALWYFTRSRQELDKPSKDDVETPPPPPKTMKDQVTMIDSFKLERKHFGTQKSFSTENVSEVDGSVGVQLRSSKFGGLGFNIKGNMTDGIFVKSIVPRGPAEACGNIFVDDRIRSLTILFEDMVFEDAVTLLSYASPYKVKLELERKLDDSPTPSPVDSKPGSPPRKHPFFRSNTLTHCHFNPISVGWETREKTPSPKPEMIEEAKPVAKKNEPEPAVIEIETITQEIVKLEENEEIIAEIAQIVETRETVEVKEIPATPEREAESTPPPPPVMVSSDYSSDGSRPKSETETISTTSMHSDEDKVEKVASPPPPPIPAASPPPPPKTPSPAKIQPKERKVLPKPSPPQESSIPVKRSPPNKTSAQRPPEFQEARVSRIPKRSESIKTPIVERKLPPLPKSALQKREPAEDKSDIWSRLYQEKKGNLRKTRDVKSPVDETQKDANANYGTLNREKKEKIQANEEILERQKQELRQLGILD